MSVKPLKSDGSKACSDLDFVLETQIIDTGIGIAADRQEILFVPFKELKQRIGISKS